MVLWVASLNWWCQLLPCFDGKFNSGSLMKNFHRVSTKWHRDMKSGVSRSKNSTFSQARSASAVSCSNMWKSNYPHRHVNVITLYAFCGCNWKTSRICHQWSRFSLSEQVSNWQHQLRIASLYLWHTMMSVLRHDLQKIFNQLPHFVEIF